MGMSMQLLQVHHTYDATKAVSTEQLLGCIICCLHAQACCEVASLRWPFMKTPVPFCFLRTSKFG